MSKVLGDADLTFTAVPVARDNESVRERIMVIARNSGLAVHHVTVHDLGGRLTVSIDLEVELLVIGATGHSALYERLIGSRADRIVQLAHCPVLAVKAQ